MGYLEAHAQGFLAEFEELEKEASRSSKKIVKETRKGWNTTTSRKGRRPMRVDTLLKKEKAGTLGGYKLAEVLGAFAKLGGEDKERFVMPYLGPRHEKQKNKPGDMPTRDDVHYEQARRADDQVDAATVVRK